MSRWKGAIIDVLKMMFGGEWPDRALYSQNGWGQLVMQQLPKTVHKSPSHSTCQFTMIHYFILKAEQASVFFLLNSVSCKTTTSQPPRPQYMMGGLMYDLFSETKKEKKIQIGLVNVKNINFFCKFNCKFKCNKFHIFES